MNRLDAKNEMFSAVAARWASVLPPIVGTNHELRYWGVKYQTEVPVTKYWGRVSMQTVSEEQEALAGSAIRRYSSVGILFVQLFAPIAENTVGTKLDNIADGLRDGFRFCTTADNVQFTRARIVDNIDPEPAWLRVNVVTEFNYNQFV